MKDWMAHHSRVDQLRDLRNIAGLNTWSGIGYCTDGSEQSNRQLLPARVVGACLRRGRLQIVRVAADTVAELTSQLVSHATALWRRAKYAVG
jgi:hypothetical protein